MGSIQQNNQPRPVNHSINSLNKITRSHKNITRALNKIISLKMITRSLSKII